MQFKFKEFHNKKLLLFYYRELSHNNARIFERNCEKL